jgi:hypothetical protein
VISRDDVFMTQRTCSLRHLDDGTAAVGSQRVRVTVTSQRSAERIAANGCGSASNFTRYRGTLPSSASKITVAVASPIPFRERSRLPVARRPDSPGWSAEIVSAARRKRQRRDTSAPAIAPVGTRFASAPPRLHDV